MNIFGTDGIRGLANSGYITPHNIMKLAVAAVNTYVCKNHQTVNSKFTVVVGKDTRLSGYMLESALTAGFISAGADVVLLGPVPTPAVAFLTRSLRADLGVVISASHNPYQDNGIKFFNSNGFKISLSDEIKISEMFDCEQKLAKPDLMGKASRLEDTNGRYIEFVKNSFPKNMTLFGMKIVIDAANGSAYRIAPQIFWELGAEITTIGTEPNGVNINKGCGATDLSALQKKVVEIEADVGIALDGDADRIIVVDELGEIVDGDYVLAAIATNWRNTKKLTSDKIVATKVSNIGLEKYLETIGLKLERADVGDKHVMEKMLEVGSNLGGEKSGHIIPTDYASTGDGIVAALQVLAYLKKEQKRASAIRALYVPYPQVFKNILKEIDVKSSVTIDLIDKIEKKILKKEGRILIRKSGTENITRLMVEATNQDDADQAMAMLEMNL